jgi:hypothetical protein
MSNKIFFSAEEIEKALDFANKMKYKHPEFVDMINTGKRRDVDEVFTSVLRGKLAEIAIAKHLAQKHKGENHNISPLDFNVYEDGVIDDFDLKFDNYTISIKSSKPIASCLLIEKHKYRMDSNGNIIRLEGKKNAVPDFYAFVKVGIDLDRMCDCYAEICGAISHRDFWRKKREIPRGTFLNRDNINKLFIENRPLSELSQGRGARLYASNYGVHLSELKPF